VRLIEADFMAGDRGFIDFDAVVTALVLEHIPDIITFFIRVREALKPGGHVYLSEIHPERIAAGTQANFTDVDTGENIALASFAHTEADIAAAAEAAGLRLIMRQDVLGGDELTAMSADWVRHLGRKMICMWTFVYERR
jgi:2-polyprenyl-3-methyl-5-hydroxy-6-metoxy-1,4-benzoquinol methylase